MKQQRDGFDAYDAMLSLSLLVAGVLIICLVTLGPMMKDFLFHQLIGPVVEEAVNSGAHSVDE